MSNNGNDNIVNFKLILDKLNVLENKMDTIENGIKLIHIKLDKCETSCKTMDEHIIFVEDVYQTLRSPLDFVRAQVNYMTGNIANTNQLPQLKNKTDEY